MRQVETGEDPAEASETRPATTEPHHLPEQLRSRPALILLTVIVAFFGVTAFVLVFKPFSDTPIVGEPALDVFAAGPFEIYEPGTITYFENERFFLVRTMDGAFLALYDLSPATQAQVEAGDVQALECRLVVREDEAIESWLQDDETPLIPGFESQGLYDECQHAAWDARGRAVLGEHEHELDRFPVETIGDIVRVNLGHRRCMNDITPTSPCIPTQ